MDIMTIHPYRACGMWVFDDPDKGLHKEPLVRGIDTMLDVLAGVLPESEGGFDLVFRGAEFPYSTRFDRVQEENGWSLYRNGELEMEGWLCPALLKYFPEGAPEEIHVWAKPLSGISWRHGHAVALKALLDAAGRANLHLPDRVSCGGSRGGCRALPGDDVPGSPD